MLFNSNVFALFFIITWALYYLPVFRRFQIGILIVSSLVFYAWELPVLVVLLVCSCLVNAVVSYLVIYGDRTRRHACVVMGVGLSLCALAFFKYGPLIARALFRPTSSVGEFLLMIPLPIGISFYTFQGISLMIDALRSDRIPEFRAIVHPSFLKHLQNTTLSIVFFPQLVAGPILKAHDYIPQIREKFLRDIQWERCFRLLIMGYFLKMVVADNLKDHTFWIEYPYFLMQPTMTLLAMLFGFSMQIFADFAGYSIIAIGLAGLFGYDVMTNFNFPYIAQSFSEFWTRWHISLSTFLKEYLYIPLGGNRKGAIRTYLNLMIVMFLGGLWHGAAWSYAVWGSVHGLALAVERFISSKITFKESAFVRVVKTVAVFVLVTFAWLLFKLPDFSQVIQYLQAIFLNLHRQGDSVPATMILLYSLPIILYHACHVWRDTRLVRWIRSHDPLAYGIMLFLLVTNSGSPSAFIYFQF